MASPRKPATQDAPPPLAGTPTPEYIGHHDHSFTLQSIMEIQKSIGVMGAKLDNVNSTLQSTKSKIEDLVGWKNKILGGAIVLGVVGTLLGFLITKFSDYITIAPPAKPAITQPATSVK